jgi:hypothetical protein
VRSALNDVVWLGTVHLEPAHLDLFFSRADSSALSGWVKEGGVREIYCIGGGVAVDAGVCYYYSILYYILYYTNILLLLVTGMLLTGR